MPRHTGDGPKVPARGTGDQSATEWDNSERAAATSFPSRFIDVQTPQGFSFRGGYIIFSGSTGYYTNFHRVDNLDIIHDCKTSP